MRGELTMLMPSKVKFSKRNRTRDKEGHFTKTRGLINQVDITILNSMYEKMSSKYLKQNLIDMKAETNISTIRTGDYSALLSLIDITIRKKSEITWKM